MVTPIELITQLTHRIELLEEKVLSLEEKIKKAEVKTNKELHPSEKKYLNFLKHRND